MSAQFLSRKAAAEFMGISVPFLDKLRNRGDLPYHRLSRKLVLLKITDLERFLQRARIDVSGGEL